MCSPISDGGAAAILCSEDVLDRFDKSRAVKVAASVIATGSERDPTTANSHVTRIAAGRAYEKAGVGPKDMSVSEVHDASAIAEIMQTENLGFCEIGEGGALAESGATTIGGQIPVNPSGGLESKGHPIGAGLSKADPTNWRHSCEGNPAPVRLKGPASGSPRTVAACTGSRRPSPASPYWNGRRHIDERKCRPARKRHCHRPRLF